MTKPVKRTARGSVSGTSREKVAVVTVSGSSREKAEELSKLMGIPVNQVFSDAVERAYASMERAHLEELPAPESNTMYMVKTNSLVVTDWEGPAEMVFRHRFTLDNTMYQRTGFISMERTPTDEEILPMECAAKKLLGAAIVDRDEFLDVLEKLCQILELTTGIHAVVNREKRCGVFMMVRAVELQMKTEKNAKKEGSSTC